MRALRGTVGGLALLVLVGCGGAGGMTVSGTVNKSGAPITFGDSEGMTITMTNGSDKFTANVDEKGAFSVLKPDGSGIPAGKYQVSYVHYQNPSPYSKVKPFRNEKKLEDWDVSPTNSIFTIDLGTK